jgi:cytochrome c oxidase assembly factor CtaG
MHDPYAWPLDPDAFVVVPALCVGYALLTRTHRPPPWRVASFSAGMLLLLAVFGTPLDTLALHHLLSAHLLQNVVVAEWAPALVVLGVPPLLARRVHVPLVLALPLWLGTYFFWHVPAVYDFALEHHHTVLHLEHATYFLTGVMLWWPVVHGRYLPQAKAMYLFAAFVLASPLGLLLALLPEPVYNFYVERPTVWGLSHTTDQQLAGVTMAAEQAIVFFAVFAWFFFRFLNEEERGDSHVPNRGPTASSPPSPQSPSSRS